MGTTDGITPEDLERARQMEQGQYIHKDEMNRLVQKEVARRVAELEAQMSRKVAEHMEALRAKKSPGMQMALDACKCLYQELATVYWEEMNRVLNLLNWIRSLADQDEDKLNSLSYGIINKYRPLYDLIEEYGEDSPLEYVPVNGSIPKSSRAKAVQKKLKNVEARMQREIGRLEVAHNTLGGLREDTYISFWPSFEALLAKDQFTKIFQEQMRQNLIVARNHLNYPHPQQ